MKHNNFLLYLVWIQVGIFVLIGGVVSYFFFFAPEKKEEVVYYVPGVVTGITDSEILIGSSAALDGPAAELGINFLTYGGEVAVKEFNDNGGVHGRTVRLVSYDDGYEPDRAAVNTEKLITEDKVFALANYVGTPTGVRVVPIVAKYQVPLVGMFTGAEAFRNPLQKYIFNIRASYYEETERAVQYFTDTLDHKKIAVFYQDDPFGYAVLAGVERALERRDMEVFATSTYVRNTEDVEQAAQEIGESGADAVVMVGTYAPLAKFSVLARTYNPQIKIHTVSFVGPEAFAESLLELNGRGYPQDIFVTQVVPPPNYVDVFDGLDRYANVLHTYYPDQKPTFGGLEGYMSMRVLLQAIGAAGVNLTREGFMRTLESFDYTDTSFGVDIAFSPENHQALHKVYMTTLVNGEYLIVPVPNSR